MTDTRKEELTALGAKLDEGVYVFDYDDRLFISEYQLTYLTDAEFGDFLEDVKTAFAEEQTIIYEENIRRDMAEIKIDLRKSADNPKESNLKTFLEEERDYSLNDFENLTRAAYNGTAKQKQIILDAIADYKAAMDTF